MKTETPKDLFTKLREAIEINPNAMVCRLRTLRRELVNIRYGSSNYFSNDFKIALDEIEQELKGDDEALFDLVMGRGYHKGVQTISFNELLYLDGNREDGIVQQVEFQVAPTTGLYLPNELQEFMMCLIPGITPDFVQNFEYGNGKLRLGKLGLYEKIGEMRRKVHEERIESIINSTFRSLLSDKVIEGKRKINEDKEEIKQFYRVITLEIFPDIALAKKLGDQHTDTLPYEAIIDLKPEVKSKIDEYMRQLIP